MAHVKLRSERIQEGYLVIGTEDMQEARKFLGDTLPDVWSSTYAGRHRKVPGQWCDFQLYPVSDEQDQRGSFLCVVFHLTYQQIKTLDGLE